MSKHVEFNNGFLTSLFLFLEHKESVLNAKSRDRADSSLFGACDHLYDIEIPEKISKKLKKRIIKAIKEALRLKNDFVLYPTKDYKKVDKIYKEFEDIIAELDKELFGFKDVTINYR